MLNIVRGPYAWPKRRGAVAAASGHMPAPAWPRYGAVAAVADGAQAASGHDGAQAASGHDAAPA